MWQYGSAGGETVFEFQLGRGREGPKNFLGDWEGILYGLLGARAPQVCGPVKVNPQDAEAVNMVTRMDALFLVDRLARCGQVSVEERLASLRGHGESWAAEIQDRWVSLHKTLPKSTLDQAGDYTLNM